MSESPLAEFSDAVVRVLVESRVNRPVPTLDERAQAMAHQLQYFLEGQYGLNASEIHVLVRLLLREKEFMQHEVFRSGCAILNERFKSSKDEKVDLAKVAKLKIFAFDLLFRLFDFGPADDELSF